MPEGLVWRTMQALDATAMDFVIVLLGFIVLAGVYYLHASQKKELERLRLDNKAVNDKLWSEIHLLRERYHRLDALNFTMAKILQLARTGKAKIVEESANGDGDYTIDRSF